MHRTSKAHDKYLETHGCHPSKIRMIMFVGFVFLFAIVVHVGVYFANATEYYEVAPNVYATYESEYHREKYDGAVKSGVNIWSENTYNPGVVLIYVGGDYEIMENGILRGYHKNIGSFHLINLLVGNQDGVDVHRKAVGFVMAHEYGHVLGLSHFNTPGHIMDSAVGDSRKNPNDIIIPTIDDLNTDIKNNYGGVLY